MASLSGVFNTQEFSDQGIPLVGGRLYTYVQGTTTQKYAYTDIAGSIPHTYTSDGIGGQYIALNSRGELSAPLYLAAGAYDISLKRYDGSTVWTRRADPMADFTSLSAAGGAALIGSGAQVVSSITALRAILKTCPANTALVTGYYAAGDGGGGSYYYDAADTTSTDNGGTIIVATDGGRWKLAQSFPVSVKQFGAKGDAATSDTAAFNLAIAYANSRGGVDASNITGTTIFIPDGRYVLGALNPITKSGCNFIGESKNGSVLLLTPGTVTFTWGNGTDIVVGGGISNVKMEYLTAPSGTTNALKFDYAFRLCFNDLLLVNIGTLASLGVSSSRVAGGITFSRLDGFINNGARSLFDLRFGAGLFLSECHVFVGGVTNPVHPASMTTVAGTHVFKCDVGVWDTLQASNCIFERFDVGLAITAGNTMVYQNFYFTNVIMDYLRRWCVYAESQAGGVIAGIRFDAASWFVSWETEAISLSGAGYNDNHNFAGKVVIAGAAGVNYTLTSSRNVTFDHMQINSCNRLGTANGAMVFAASATGFTVDGCKGNVDTTAVGLPWRAPYGISVAADADRYVVANCAFEGSTGGYSFAANASGSANRKAHNNIGANYGGYSALAMPATTVRVTNTTPFVWDLDFFGGTITGGYDKNLQGYPGALAYVHMRLEPGDTFACGYSVAPTVARFIEY